MNVQKKYIGTPTLEVLEGADNYNAWIAESILPYISSPVLEVGAGIGNISKFFTSKTPLYLSDIDITFLKILRKKFYKYKHISIKTIDIENDINASLYKKFRTIVVINVLEHIKDDTRALRNLKKMIMPEGTLILLVPAKKIAYTKLDKELGHFRRYEKNELIDKLHMTRFSIEKIYFFNIVGLFTWILRDKISRKNIHLTSHQIKLFDKIVILLKYIEKLIKIPIGISLIVIAKNEK